MDNNHNENSKSTNSYPSSVKLPKEIFEKISLEMLNSIKVDNHTKKVIKEKIIKSGNYSYISLIRKHIDFLTPIRLMILVDFVDILKAFKYYLNDYNSNKYEKGLSKDYNFINGLHEAELKLIMLEYIYEEFNDSSDIDVLFHQPQEKIDAILDAKEVIKINVTDNEGYMYVNILNPGKYIFENRSCSSITDANYILNNAKRKEYAEKFEKYFIYVPKDATVYDEAIRELEKNNIKIVYSDYSTIDIVNDVLYMEGILKK